MRITGNGSDDGTILLVCDVPGCWFEEKLYPDADLDWINDVAAEHMATHTSNPPDVPVASTCANTLQQGDPCYNDLT